MKGQKRFEDADKQAAANRLHAGERAADVAKELKVSLPTLYAWKNQFVTNGRNGRVEPQPAATAAHPNVVDQLRAELSVSEARAEKLRKAIQALTDL